MSLVDRWLSRSPQEERVAITATSATLCPNSSVSADLSVATDLRHGATSLSTPTATTAMSQPVANRPRHENSQDSATLSPSSQMSQSSQDAVPDLWADAEEERAAIVGVPREWAEGFARLDPDRPPAGVPLRRWQAVIDAIGTFLDRWAAEAVARGWQAADIFGADSSRPEVTWLNAGPLW
jgi:hypothetical protein